MKYIIGSSDAVDLVVGAWMLEQLCTLNAICNSVTWPAAWLKGCRKGEDIFPVNDSLA